MFIDLFQEIEVENLFKALDLCMEYVRLDLHVFNVGAHVTCSYSNDLESLSQAEGCNVNMIIEVPYLFEAFMEYASPEMKLYYEKLTEIVKLKYVEKRVLDAFTDNGIDLSNYTHCIIVKRNFYLAW